MERCAWNTVTHRHNPSPSPSLLASLPCTRGAGSQADPQLPNNMNMTEFTLSHTTSDLVGDRSCFLHSISRNLISLQYIVLHANSMSTEKGEKLTENILPDGEN